MSCIMTIICSKSGTPSQIKTLRETPVHYIRVERIAASNNNHNQNENYENLQRTYPNFENREQQNPFNQTSIKQHSDQASDIRYEAR